MLFFIAGDAGDATNHADARVGIVKDGVVGDVGVDDKAAQDDGAVVELGGDAGKVVARQQRVSVLARGVRLVHIRHLAHKKKRRKTKKEKSRRRTR